MPDATFIPDDLATCQEQLRAAGALQAQWGESLATLKIEHETLNIEHATLRAQLESLQQENAEQQFTIKSLLQRLYGRRSERLDSPGQLHFSFVVGEPLAAETVSALAALDQADAEFVEQVIEKRRRNRQKPRSEELPAHLERRTQRVEPTLPADCPFELIDCQLIGVDVVENLEYDPPQLWVLRLEYPKYIQCLSVVVPKTASNRLFCRLAGLSRHKMLNPEKHPETALAVVITTDDSADMEC